MNASHPSVLRIVSAKILLAMVSLGSALLADDGPNDWNRFRGPNGSGLSNTTGLPTEFGPDKNVVWKTSLPAGHSSPILWGDRIYLTAYDGKSLLIIALDRGTGEILWQREVQRSREEPIDPRNNPASPSPAVDADMVVVFFPDYGMLAYDHAGNEQWSTPLGPFDNIYGMGASPLIVGNKVLLVCDQSLDSYVMAVDKVGGDLIWLTNRPEARSGHSTPILWTSENGELQLIVPGSFLLTSYSVETGDRLWWVRGLSFEMKSVPVIHNGVIYINGYGSPLNQPGNQVQVPTYSEVIASNDANGDRRISKAEMPQSRARGYFSFVDLDRDQQLDKREWNFLRASLESQNGMMAIRAGGHGDMTDTAVLWNYQRAVPQLPSPIVYEGILYMVNDGGVVTSLDPKTGERLAQGRLEGAVDAYYASPVAADGKIFMVSELGLVAVLVPDGSLDTMAVNDLDDAVYATPAIADGRLYIRTRSTLYCFAEDTPGS